MMIGVRPSTMMELFFSEGEGGGAGFERESRRPTSFFFSSASSFAFSVFSHEVMDDSFLWDLLDATHEWSVRKVRSEA